MCSSFFFFNDTATTEIYTLSLHDALPIFGPRDRDPSELHLRQTDRFRQAAERERQHLAATRGPPCRARRAGFELVVREHRSEEHTSELQSQSNLVCRLLLEKKTNATTYRVPTTHPPRSSPHPSK